jgi:flagellar motor switch protein FliN/FliY
VAQDLEYEQFDAEETRAPASSSGADMSRLAEIPMELAVEIGRTAMTVGETMQLRVGSIVELEREAGEPVDLLVNGTPIARGEVVVIDDRYGLRIVEIIDDGGERGAEGAAELQNGSVAASSEE